MLKPRDVYAAVMALMLCGFTTSEQAPEGLGQPSDERKAQLVEIADSVR